MTIRKYDMQLPWMQIGGNHIRVDRACPPRKKLKGDNSHLYDNKRTVFVGNLPFDVKVRCAFETIVATFALYATINVFAYLLASRMKKFISYFLA